MLIIRSIQSLRRLFFVVCLLFGCACYAPVSARSSAYSPVTAAVPTPVPAEELDAEAKYALLNAPPSTRWPAADAVLLLDSCDVTVRPDGTLIQKFRIIKLLRNEHARSDAEIKIGYNNRYQNVKVLYGRTMQHGGAIKKLSMDLLRTSSPHSDYALYDETREVGFSLPGIEDNAIIDYAWEVTTQPIFLPGNFWDSWNFTATHVSVLSRYTLRLPTGMNVRWQVHPNNDVKPIVVTSPDGSSVYVWSKANNDPVLVEASMPQFNTYSTWLQVTNLKDWQDYAAWWWKLQQPCVQADDPIRKTVAQVTMGKKTDAEKAGAIYDYVANHIRYVGLEFGINAYQPHPASAVLDNLYGDCKDKATLLITMLREVGISADPVLLHTQDSRPTHTYLPTLSWFDHCIAVATVSGKKVWLDATAESCAYGDLPVSDRQSEGFVIHEGIGTFERIPGYQPAENGLLLELKWAADLKRTVQVALKMIGQGSYAQALRGSIRQMDTAQREAFLKSMINFKAKDGDTEAKVTRFVFPDDTVKSDPYIIDLGVSVPNYITFNGATVSIPVGLTLKTSDIDCSAAMRVRPIVVSAGQNRVHAVFDIPQGYKTYSLPHNATVTGPLQQWERKLVKSSDGRSVTLTITTTAQEGQIAATDYQKLKKYYETLKSFDDDEIVLLSNKIKLKSGSTVETYGSQRHSGSHH